MRLARFLVVGGSGVLVNTLILFILYQLAGVAFLVASAIAVEVAIVNNYLWNDRWTFGRTGVSLDRFVRFNLVSLVGLVITTGTAWTLVHQVGAHYLAANLVGIGLATLANFVANLRWTWRRDGRGALMPPRPAANAR